MGLLSWLDRFMHSNGGGGVEESKLPICAAAPVFLSRVIVRTPFLLVYDEFPGQSGRRCRPYAVHACMHARSFV